MMNGSRHSSSALRPSTTATTGSSREPRAEPSWLRYPDIESFSKRMVRLLNSDGPLCAPLGHHACVPILVERMEGDRAETEQISVAMRTRCLQAISERLTDRCHHAPGRYCCGAESRNACNRAASERLCRPDPVNWSTANGNRSLVGCRWRRGVGGSGAQSWPAVALQAILRDKPRVCPECAKTRSNDP